MCMKVFDMNEIAWEVYLKVFKVIDLVCFCGRVSTDSGLEL